MNGARLMASWVLALFLAAMYLWIADLTFFPPSANKNVVFLVLAEKSGIALWEPTGRFLVGCSHVLAALLVFIPWTRRIGALLCGLIAAGAVAVHFIWLGIELPVEHVAGVAAGDQLKKVPTDGGQLFYLAVALLIASVLLVFIHPGKSSGGGSKSSYSGAH
jgi:hypothetical protein